MILSDGEIQKLIKQGCLQIRPMELSQIQPASVDIRLGNTFSVLEDSPNGIIRLSEERHYKTIHTDTYLLLPGQFVLATTMEYIALPNNLTGFEGEITLELFNANRYAIELQAGHRLGQLVFARMGEDALHPYCGKYQGQKGATGSRVFMDFPLDIPDIQ